MYLLDEPGDWDTVPGSTASSSFSICERTGSSWKASRIAKLHRGRTYTWTEGSYRSHWYCEEPALRLAAGDESPACLFGDIHSALETCLLACTYSSYTYSKNSSRWFPLFPIFSKKKKKKRKSNWLCPYLLIFAVYNIVFCFSGFSHTTGSLRFTFALPAPWFSINKIFGYYPFLLK